jgi:hypothetical protein
LKEEGRLDRPRLTVGQSERDRGEERQQRQNDNRPEATIQKS